MEKSSTATVEDKIRSLFAKVKPKHKEQVLAALKERPQHADKLQYLQGWFYVS